MAENSNDVDLSVTRVSVVRVSTGDRREAEQEIIRESPLTLFVNEQQVVTLLTIPYDLPVLAVGFLYSEGWISKRSDIVGVAEDAGTGIVRVRLTEAAKSAERFWEKRLIGSGCGKATSFYSVLDAMQCKPVSSSFQCSIEDIVRWMKEVLRQAPLYHRTRGTHSVALFEREGMRLLEQDIGRHNALDRILGKCLIRDISTADTVLLTTGRLSSEMVVKVARAGVPILASRSSTTTLAVSLADRLKITILGCLRGGGMQVYTHPQRILTDGDGE